MNEFARIARWTAHRQTPEQLLMQGVTLGIGDDAALAEQDQAYELVMCCDSMVEEVHFNRWTMSMADVGYKALASTISDVAAMGGIPQYALLSLIVPRSMKEEDLDTLYDGIYTCAQAYDVVVVGGDTSATEHGLVLAVTTIGKVERGQGLRRSAAKPGDVIFITGELGGAAAGLDYLMKQRQVMTMEHDTRAASARWHAMVQAHQRPEPQVKAGRLLLTSGHCHALNDISDGLVSELREIALASDCSMRVNEEQLPIGEQLQLYADETNGDALDWVLTGGEDYQLVGTMPADAAAAVQRQFAEHQLVLTVIGEVTNRLDHSGYLDGGGLPEGLEERDACAVSLKRRDGRIEIIEHSGYDHFGAGR